MTALEIEGTIVIVTVITGFLIRSGKWTLEELESLVIQYQKLKATINGTVNDPSGAVVAGATVTPTNNATKLTPKQKPSEQPPVVTDTRSKDESDLAA